MPPHLSWRDLIPGLIALATLIGVGAAVLLFTGVGRIRGDTQHVHVVTTQARGVTRGTEVWLSGQKIGVVEDIGFRGPSSDSSGTVVLTLKLRASDATLVRRDSRVRVRAGANVIGPMVVYVEGGTPGSQTLRDGDTLHADTQSDMSVATARLGEAMANAGPIMADAKRIIALAADDRGTVGALLTAMQSGSGPIGEARALFATATARRARASLSPGPRDVMARARVAMARVDTIRALLASPSSSLGRFRRDSTLARDIGALAEELARVRSDLAAADGTLPRLRRDSTIWFAVSAAREEMALLFEDVRKHPVRYLNF